MRPHNLTFFLAAFLGLGPMRASAQATPDSLEQKMETIFKAYDRSDGPGLAALIVKDGRVIFKKGYGMANLEYDAHITPASVFDIASVSKQFTGFALSTLIQEGRLSPDDDIHKYLPDVPQFASRITVRNLIHHTSGLRDWPSGLNMAGWRWDDPFGWSDIMRMVKQQTDLDFAPGSEYQYSNTGYNLLAAIVAKVSGQSFPDYIREHIFKPLGMDNSRVLADFGEVIPRLATSYHPFGAGYGKTNDMLTAWGSSSIFTTVEDLAKWVVFFQHGLDAHDPVITRMIQTDTLNNGSPVGYAYGLEVRSDHGVTNIQHTGGWASYSTIISNYPDRHLSIILLGNSEGFDSWGKAEDVARIFVKAIGVSARPAVAGASGGNPGSLPAVKVDPVLVNKYLGTYLLGPHWYVTFSLQDDSLMSQANGEPKFPAWMKSDSLMWVPAYNSTVVFLNVTDKAQAIRYHGHVSPRIQPIDIATLQLGDFAGDYYSPELEVTYHLLVVDGKLMMHQMRLGDNELTADLVTRDAFSGPTGSIQFIRSGGVVDGFTVSSGRPRNVRFVKVPASPKL